MSLANDVSNLEIKVARLEKENERLKQENDSCDRIRSRASVEALTKILASVGEIKEKLEEFSKNITDILTGILMSLSVEDLGLTVRAVNCLAAEKIFLVEDLTKRTELELMTPTMGKKTINEIKEALAEYGLSLRKKS